MSRYHFTGIAGVGMSALAEAALQQGHRVSGSDRLVDSSQETQVVRALRAMGAAILPQDGSGVAGGVDAIVISTAIEDSNADLAAARAARVQVMHRSDMLGLLTRGHGLRIAVSGTCGKSTVTGLAGWLLNEAGKDPAVINGAPLAGWMGPESVGSARMGRGDVCIFEADESDRSLLNYEYEVAVITNSSADHFGQGETDELFDRFAARAGKVLDARRDGFYQGVKFSGRGFTYRGVRFEVPMPGRHNLFNAAISVKICESVDCDLSLLAGRLPAFSGISRRLEHIGTSAGVSVYDDYAHNTEKIRAVLSTLAEAHSSVVAIWRPHGYGPLRSMMDALTVMFSETMRAADCLILLPVYDAGGTADRSINSDTLAVRLKGAKCRVILAGGIDDALNAAVASRSQAVVTLGARDPGLSVLARSILQSIRG